MNQSNDLVLKRYYDNKDGSNAKYFPQMIPNDSIITIKNILTYDTNN